MLQTYELQVNKRRDVSGQNNTF